jgi:heptosyltransferase-3
MKTIRHTPRSILVIRRDNIGDLVCTTPVFDALREHFPAARICALVNSYNRSVLEHNPAVDAIYWYSKAKHEAGDKSALQVYWERYRLMRRLRRMHFDHVILAAPGFQPRSLLLARMVKPAHIVGFTEPGAAEPSAIDVGIPYTLSGPMHEAEDVFRLLKPFGIDGSPGAARVYPDRDAMRVARHALGQQTSGTVPVIGIHISARKPSQRWPAEHFVALIRVLYRNYGARFMLFWAPGGENDPRHPGDDAKAQSILAHLHTLPVVPYETHTLPQLIGGLSICDAVICSDGGAMHIAAGLNKPIVCFFGKSDSSRWYPWQAPHVMLCAPQGDVANITPEQAQKAFASLLTQHGVAFNRPLGDAAQP